MAVIYHNKVVLTLKIGLSNAALESRRVASPRVVGEELAAQVHNYSEANGLGYYPALDFFIEQGGVEKSLLDEAKGIGWISAQIVRQQVAAKLKPVFSNVRIESMQCVAFSMPNVRPKQREAIAALARHFTPSVVKLDLLVTIIQKHPITEGLEGFARKLVSRWLNSCFESLEVTNARLF